MDQIAVYESLSTKPLNKKRWYIIYGITPTRMCQLSMTDAISKEELRQMCDCVSQCNHSWTWDRDNDVIQFVPISHLKISLSYIKVKLKDIIKVLKRYEIEDNRITQVVREINMTPRLKRSTDCIWKIKISTGIRQDGSRVQHYSM